MSRRNEAREVFARNQEHKPYPFTVTNTREKETEAFDLRAEVLFLDEYSGNKNESDA